MAGKWSQGNNLDDKLRSTASPIPPTLIKNWDTNFALGGPIVRDRLWFYNVTRTNGYTGIPASTPTRTPATRPSGPTSPTRA